MGFNEKMTAIADNIRAKTGVTEALSLDGMAEGVTKVYDKGRTDEWSDFWDVFQINGTREKYNYGFYADVQNAWNDKNFKPKYDMKPTNMNRYMRYCGITNLEEILERQGVSLDTSNCKMMMLAFGDMPNLEVVPFIDASNATNSNGGESIFSYSQKLRTIRKFKVAENIDYSGSFDACYSLENIVVEGIFGMSVSFSACPLTIESMKSIITALKDCSTENQGAYTLTLKDECKTALEADTETIEFSGQTYTYFNLITAKGWNLA